MLHIPSSWTLSWSTHSQVETYKKSVRSILMYGVLTKFSWSYIPISVGFINPLSYYRSSTSVVSILLQEWIIWRFHECFSRKQKKYCLVSGIQCVSDCISTVALNSWAQDEFGAHMGLILGLRSPFLGPGKKPLIFLYHFIVFLYVKKSRILL